MRTTGLLFLACICFLQNAESQPYTISTIAGTTRLLDGGPATAAPLRLPVAVALDSEGNLYIADEYDNRIRKVDASGTISTYAGTGIPGYSGDRGPASKAQLNFPTSIALDSKGNMYIADTGNAVIRRIAADGTINTVAGNGNPMFAGDNGPATSAQIDPVAVAVDSQGNIYLSDGLNFRIRKIDTNGIITTIAGTGMQGYLGDNGPATSAWINFVTDVAADNAGNVYLADYYNYEVREIDTSGMITDFAGGPLADTLGDNIPATTAAMVPTGLAFDGSDSLYISDTNVYNTEVRRVDLSTGIIYGVAGNGAIGFSGDGGVAVSAELGYPGGLVFGGGAVYFADETNARVRMVANNVINTVAGTSIRDDGPATDAFLNFPEGVAIDGTGNILVGDTGNLEARVFKTGGNINSIGQLEGGSPYGAGVDSSGNFYITDEEPNFPSGDIGRVLQIAADGTTAIIAGNGPAGFSGDGGAATLAVLNSPQGVAVDAAGNIYVADYGNHRVRKVDTSGNINTIAGNGKTAYSGDNGPATSAGIDPFAVAVDNAGNVFVVDQSNHRIREIAPNNTITTVAGNGLPGYSGDGGAATQAQLKFPAGVAVDGSGNLYIADEGNSVIRRVTAQGLITTIAGNRTPLPSSGDGGPAIAAQLDPLGITVDGMGNVYVTDSINDRVRMLAPQIVKPASMTIVSGDGQSGTVGTNLAAPVVLKIADGTGTGLAGAVVTFTVSPEGAATLSPSPAISLNDGTVSLTVTLGSNPGPITITALSYGVANVTITLTANPSNSPSIASGGIVSAGLSNPRVQVLSPNAIVTIFGQNFAPAGTAAQGGVVDGQIPTMVAGVCVEFGTVAAPIFSVYPNQINVQVPAVAPGNVPVQVITDCNTPQAVASPPVSMPAQATAPEFFYFTQAASGPNPIAAINAVTGGYVGPAGLISGATFTPAKAGDYLELFATGFGATNPAFAPGMVPSGLPSVTAPYSITFGGVTLKSSEILYVGLSQFAGLYQVNIQVPEGVPDGNQPLTITVGGVASPANAYIAVQNGQ